MKVFLIIVLETARWWYFPLSVSTRSLLTPTPVRPSFPFPPCIAFQLAMKSISLVRYLSDQLESLPLSVAGRLARTHDAPVALAREGEETRIALSMGFRAANLFWKVRQRVEENGLKLCELG